MNTGAAKIVKYIQIKFKFSSGAMIFRIRSKFVPDQWFLTELCLVNSEEKGNFTFRSASQQPLHTFNSYLMYRYMYIL